MAGLGAIDGQAAYESSIEMHETRRIHTRSAPGAVDRPI